MQMRLQELHPSMVHAPIVFLPTSLAADALGRATGDATLLRIGRWGTALGAGSAALAAVSGLLAQEASRFDDEARDLLTTHRTLNLILLGAATWLALRRSRRERPDAVHLAAGAAAIGTMAYSAYLGGRMVYGHGVGVEEAGGIRIEDAPRLSPENAADAARVAAHHVAHGLRAALRETAWGRLVPALTGRAREGRGNAELAPAEQPSG